MPDRFWLYGAVVRCGPAGDGETFMKSLRLKVYVPGVAGVALWALCSVSGDKDWADDVV
jgi:hypothetical protein